MRPIMLAAFAATLLGSSAAGAASISKEVIQRPIRERMNEIRGCWNEASKDRDPPVGRMVIRYVIGTEGAVEKVTIVENATGHRGLARCVSGVFSRLEYPAAVQPITVNYPLSFAVDEE